VKSPTSKYENRFSLIPVKEITLFLVSKLDIDIIKREKKVSGTSNTDFLKYSHFKMPIGV